MAFCRNCGVEIDADAKFCPACGKSTGVGDSSAKKSAEDMFNQINDTEDYTHECSNEDIEDNKIISLFAYLGILILVPVFGAKDSKFAKFHVSQGVNLIVASLAYSILSGIIGAVFSWLPVVSTLVSIIFSVGGVLITILIIIGIVNAVNGKAKELPIIGSWKIVNV